MAGDLKRAETFFDEVVRGFIYGDIQRAVDAKANYLAALGLVCYTEFMGGLARGNLQGGNSARNFNCFFDRLGQGYKQFRVKHDVYRIYRCGLVHEYLIKAAAGRQTATVLMSDKRGIWPIGAGTKVGGGYVFVVGTYFRHFKEAANQVLVQARSDGDALARFTEAIDSVF